MTLTFKIQLRDIKKPPVWRRLEIPGSFTFGEFHMTIQAAFGWWNYHLYQFEKSPFGYGWKVKEPHESDWEIGNEVMDSQKTLVSTFLKKKNLKKFVYVYDFGDSWVHDITLEKVDEKKELPHPICLAGKGACPQEDSGGTWGYEEIKRLFAEEPDSEETQEYREWMGLDEDEEFDPKHFDIDEVNAKLGLIRVKPMKQETKQLFKSVSLLDTMADLNKEDIFEFANDLHLKVDGRLGLEKSRKAYVEAILSHPQQVLFHLPFEDLRAIEKLAKGEDGPNVVDVYDDYRQYLLVYYGMADEADDDEGNHYLRFGDDFRDAVIPHIKESMDNMMVHIRVTIESYIEGLANLFGLVSRRLVKETLVRFHQAHDMERAETLLNEFEDFSLLINWMEFDLAYPEEPTDDTLFYVSRYGWDAPLDLRREIQKYDNVCADYRKFSEMEILEAARSPMPLIPNPKYREFYYFLKDEIGLHEWHALETCHDLWYFAMHEGDELFEHDTPVQYFKDVVLNSLEVSGNLYKKALAMLDDYMDNMPRWQLKGHTAKEMKMTKTKKTSSDSKQIFGDLNPYGITMPILTTRKVGRNDPCPCGSGKKYKNCCGRGN